MSTQPSPLRRPLPDASPREARASRTWIGIIVGLLLFAVGTQAVLIAYALGDPSVVAEPDYYRKALAWEATQAQAARNAALGWSLRLEAGPLEAGRRELRVRLCDAAGAPLDGAAIALEGFHKARRAQALRAELAGAGDGMYRAVLPLARPGRWELRFVVSRGEETFTRTIERDLPLGALTSGVARGPARAGGASAR